MTPEPGGFDPHYDPRYELGYRDGVRAWPGGVLDRDQARAALRPFVLRSLLDEALDAVAACVRPVEGVVVTPEEARMVVQLHRIITLGVGSNAMLPGTSALVARLEREAGQ